MRCIVNSDPAVGTEHDDIFIAAIHHSDKALGHAGDLEIILSDERRHAERTAGLPLAFSTMKCDQSYRFAGQLVADLAALASAGIGCWYPLAPLSTQKIRCRLEYRASAACDAYRPCARVEHRWFRLLCPASTDKRPGRSSEYCRAVHRNPDKRRRSLGCCCLRFAQSFSASLLFPGRRFYPKGHTERTNRLLLAFHTMAGGDLERCVDDLVADTSVLAFTGQRDRYRVRLRTRRGNRRALH